MRRVVRSFLTFVASTFFGSLLILSALGIALRFTIAEPQTVKSWLADSGVYESVVEEVAKNMTIQQANDRALVQINSDEIIDAAQQAFPSSTIKREGEAVTDGFYSWFKGDTTGPEFRVDLTQEKADFAKIMANTLGAKIAELPECKEAGRFSVQAFDPFQADCRPKGVDLTGELVDFEKQIYESTDFLSQPVITGGDVQVDKDGQKERVGSAYPWAQRAYSGLLWVPFVLVALTVLCVLALVFFSSVRRQGVRRVGAALFLAGVSLLASGLFLGTVLQNTIRSTIASDDSQRTITENIVNPLLEQIVDKTYSRYSIYFGAGYLSLALFVSGGLFLSRGKKEKHEPEHTHHDLEQPSTPEPAPLPQQQPAPPQSIYEQPAPRPEPTSVPPLPPPQTLGSEHHNRPHREVTRRPPMIQG